MSNTTIAIIGGSGLYDLPGLENVEEIPVETPFGDPSSAVISGTIGTTRMLFLARHGKGHRFTPSEVNYKANVFALKKLGATHLISVSAVGSLAEEIRPGDLVVVSQYIDRTKGRPSTYFENGIVGHVMFADPVCAELSHSIYESANALGLTVHNDATLLTMEGPAFSTRAESHLHRQMGANLIGMTAMPEAKLAREAELCYATLALATDYDCWHESEEDVTVDAVLQIMSSNVDKAQKVVARVAENAAQMKRACPCATSLEYAIVTDRGVIPKETIQKMKPIFGRVL